MPISISPTSFVAASGETFILRAALWATDGAITLANIGVNFSVLQYSKTVHTYKTINFQYTMSTTAYIYTNAFQFTYGIDGNIPYLQIIGPMKDIELNKAIEYIEIDNNGALIMDVVYRDKSARSNVASLSIDYFDAANVTPSITLTPSPQNAQLTVNGQPFYTPVEISTDAVIGAIGNVYSVQITTDNATATVSGSPITSGQTVPVTQVNTAIQVTGNPAVIIPNVGDDTQLLIDGTPATSGNRAEITGVRTVESRNTKPTPTITFNYTEDTAEIYLNEVKITPNTVYPLSENATVSIDVRSEVSLVTVTYENMERVVFNDTEVKNGDVLTLNGGEYTLNAIGAKAIPSIVVNGEGVNTLSVNGESIDPSDMPYTFTPRAGQVNSIYVSGDGEARTITISGTHIESMTVNNVPVQLPYTVTVTEPLDISVSGEIYQLDVSSKGGAIIMRRKKDGTEETISDGSKVHTIVDVDQDQYLSIDGTHILTVSGQDIKTITINGVSVDVSQLPVTISNNNMTASVVIGGFPPSEIHVIGSYIQTASLDGNAVAIGADGSVTLEVEVRDENHFLTINGSQPRDVNLTFNDNGTTDIEMDGQKVNNGQVYATHRDRFISALPEPVPVNFDVDELSFIKVDGVAYVGNFQVDVSRETNVEVNSSSCVLTIDYGDNSYQITVPQRMVTLTAPHRDGWIFDTWTSNDVGIINPRMVQCNIDLSGKTRAHIVANYQRYLTIDKPNHWN